ncbi:MAG: uroporphyrinogen decarboxylase family protein [Saccharofermentanales bacterium]
MNFNSMTCKELKSVIDGQSIADRIPVIIHFWVHPETFGDKEKEIRQILSEYPCDANIIEIKIPEVYRAPADDPEYRWVDFDDPYFDEKTAIDEKIAINDWSQLERILEKFPDPYYKGMFPDIIDNDGRYKLGHWWNILFERHWSLRGMINALTDFYLYPDEVHKLYQALTDFYMIVIERGKQELGLDGIFLGDDIGTQTGPFFSPEIFRIFYRPYYKQIIDKAHSFGMHVWLHSCGDVELFIPDFIDMGLDILHPIQKYTMDEKEISAKYGRDICIWAGFDVQRIIPWGTVREVREEVRFMTETYYRPEGKLILGAGNGINGDCPTESLSALFDEIMSKGRFI